MNNLKGKVIRLAYVGMASMTLLAATSAHAQSGSLTVDQLDQTNISNQMILGEASPEELVISIINWTLGILALIAVILILIGGFRWMTAGGNEEKVESAKKTLYAAIIGLVIILAGWGISVYVINNLLDFTDANSVSSSNS
jgi:amino acid transporter